MFLIDTNVFSELAKPEPNHGVVRWLADHENGIFISSITIAEIQSGIARLVPSRRRETLQSFLNTLRENYSGSIIPFAESDAIAWGFLDAQLHQKGRKIPARDSLLAATALARNLAIVTRNEKDFAPTEVKIVNPWKAPDR
ncbi:MAG: type II toxin-antitoxin system VapC family toxin [Verrucomicrobia bacterium]|nr:type II toxin-antitoxin system VapC family toxin [Verrucomicrobiota bacterium]